MDHTPPEGATSHDEDPGRVLAALADPTRRAILTLLGAGELAVGELAGRLPVTRPAVSQHLRVLREAGLAEERTVGTRHLFRVSPAGLEKVRAYVGELWGEALDRYAAAARDARREGGDMPDNLFEPVLKTIVVPLPPGRAFELFFAGIATWWPLGSHSVYGNEAVAVAVDGRAGGRIVETTADGRTADWGKILTWDPPRRAVFTWHPGYDDESATEVEVRFAAEGDLTRVDLVHSGWESLGNRAGETRRGYDTGWNLVFAVRFGAAAHRG